MLFSTPADFFFKMNFFQKKHFRNTIRVSNGLDPDQGQHSVSVGPELVQTVCKGYQQTIKDF